MATILTFCEYNGSNITSGALAAISCARQAAEKHGADSVLLLIGKDASSAADHAAKYANKVVIVEDPALEHPLAETYAPIIANTAKEHGASVVVAVASSIGKDIMPRAAALLEAGMASDIAEVLDKNQFKRAILAGNAFATCEVSTNPIFVTARQSQFDSAPELGSAGEVLKTAASGVDALGAEFVKLESTSSDRPDLNDASVVVAGGRGMKNGENFKELEKLADLMGAAMGASRAATDAGFVPADWQVGQTGKIVAPDLYFCVAISGAIQHLAGMKGSKTIVAINKDPEAPIFQVADYGLVDTWENTLPGLIEEIQKVKA